MTYLPFQQRVVDEKRDLDVKISALTAFLSNTERPSIEDEDLILLEKQLDAMLRYSAILGQRIARF